MLPSNLNLNIGKPAGHNKKVLISNIDMNICSNRDMNKVAVFHQKSCSLAAPSKTHTFPKIHSMKSLDKTIMKTIQPTDKKNGC